MAVPQAPAPARERLLEAAYACVARYGLAKTTMEDVARQAGLSRATVYRYFPRGKDQLVREVVAWEAGRFFERLARAVGHHSDLTDLLVETLVFAHRSVQDHDVLQKILETEPERLLPVLTVENARLITLVKQFLVMPMRGTALRPGVEAEAAADYVARMLLSHIGAPGTWPIDDPAELRRLVETELLAGIVA